MKKTVIAFISGVIGGVVGTVTTLYKTSIKIEKIEKKSNKYRSYYNILNKMLFLKETGKDIGDFLIENGYTNIAVYGMGGIGERLYDELQGSKVKVCYAIDQNTCSIYNDLSIIEPDGELDENIDAVIVTSVHVYEDVQKKLSEKLSVPIISLEDFIMNIY
ncbi:putative uncharacterized protein [Clostridium sp. CAG:253]|nr:putative uncharacterized protein [Clostridium sp. CAG:253]